MTKVVFEMTIMKDNDGNFIKELAEGIAIEIPELREFDFVYFKDATGYTIMEVRSGCMFACCKLKKEIREAIDKRLSRFGVEKCKSIVEAGIMAFSKQSPKFMKHFISLV